MESQSRTSCQKKIDDEKKMVSTIMIQGQKKVEVARGVIELGQILKETKEGLNTEQFIQWLSDSRVGFKKSQAYKYIKIANEYNDIFSTSDGKILNQLSVNKLFELASAPEEVKEDVANSKDLQMLCTNNIWVIKK